MDLGERVWAGLAYLATGGPIRTFLGPPVAHVFNRFPEVTLSAIPTRHSLGCERHFLATLQAVIFALACLSYHFLLEKDEERACWAAYATRTSLPLPPLPQKASPMGVQFWPAWARAPGAATL